MKQWAKLTQQKNGFTIVELIIVVVIIAIIATLTVVGWNNFQQRAYDANAKQILTDLGRALQTYKAKQNGTVEPFKFTREINLNDETKSIMLCDGGVPTGDADSPLEQTCDSGTNVTRTSMTKEFEKLGMIPNGFTDPLKNNPWNPGVAEVYTVRCTVVKTHGRYPSSTGLSDAITDFYLIYTRTYGGSDTESLKQQLKSNECMQGEVYYWLARGTTNPELNPTTASIDRTTIDEKAKYTVEKVCLKGC